MTQTFQSLSDQITDQVLTPNETTTTTTQTTTTTTETRNNEIINQSHSRSRSENGVNLPQVFLTKLRLICNGSFSKAFRLAERNFLDRFWIIWELHRLLGIQLLEWSGIF